MKIYTLLVAALAVLAFVACGGEKEFIYSQLPVDFIGGFSDFEGDTVDVLHFQTRINGSGSRVVKNNDELKQAFSGELPDVNVDFNKNNAVVISGVSNYGVSFIKARLDKEGESYKMKVAVEQNMLCVIEDWSAVVPVPKEVTNDNLVFDSAFYYKPF